jgi:hypothetical protein
MRLVSRALSYGASRVSATRTEWNLAGSCQSPVTREIHARPPAADKSVEHEFLDQVHAIFPGAMLKNRDHDARPTRPKYIIVKPGTAIPLTLVMQIRCRKCDRCRALRQLTWAARAKAETQVALRTWFGTLTLKPEEQVRFLNQARMRLREQGFDFDQLPFGEQFTERHKQISPHITRYLKRVRKESQAKFRFLCVAEHHKSGDPHYHLLVHEHSQCGVKHATLASQWLLGFEKWRLVSTVGEATYLTKYLAKATVARVRASGAYGKGLSHSEKCPSVKRTTPPEHAYFLEAVTAGHN